MTGLILGIALAVAAVVLVALPFLREPASEDDRLDAPTAEDERRLVLVEERDRALAALKELEFDHRSGKIGDDDYRGLVGPLRRSAAEALRGLDAVRFGTEPAAGASRVRIRRAAIGNDAKERELTDLAATGIDATTPAPPPAEATPPAPDPVPEPGPQE